MSENSRAYITALFGLDAVVQRVVSDQWSLPSPCEGWDAAEVVNHNILMAHMITELTRANSAAVPATGADGEWRAPHGEGYVLARHLFAAPRIAEDRDPIALWNASRDLVLDALDAPGATGVEARSPWGHTTVDEFLGLAFYDPLVHTWDLARAVDQLVILDPALVERALAVLQRPGDGRDLRQPISLADPVVTDRDDAVSRLIAAAGRDPEF